MNIGGELRIYNQGGYYTSNTYLRMGIVNNVNDYQKADNTPGPWIYAFHQVPGVLNNYRGSIGIRVENAGSWAGLIIGKGKNKWADVYAKAYYRMSDKRFKKDIKTINNTLNNLLQIRGVEYKFKDGNTPGMGVIAQEIEPYFPNLVRTNPNGYKTVDYEGFSGVFIEAIKEQQKQIERQQQEIDELKKIIAELRQ